MPIIIPIILPKKHVIIPVKINIKIISIFDKPMVFSIDISYLLLITITNKLDTKLKLVIIIINILLGYNHY